MEYMKLLWQFLGAPLVFLNKVSFTLGTINRRCQLSFSGCIKLILRGYCMVKVCLLVILAPVCHIGPRANMTYRCQYD